MKHFSRRRWTMRSDLWVSCTIQEDISVFFVSAVCVSVLKLVFHTAHISVVYLLLLKCSLNELECTPISSDVVSTVTLLEPKKHQLRALYWSTFGCIQLALPWLWLMPLKCILIFAFDTHIRWWFWQAFCVCILIMLLMGYHRQLLFTTRLSATNLFLTR